MTSIDRQLALMADALNLTPEQLRSAAERAGVRLGSAHPLPRQITPA